MVATQDTFLSLVYSSNASTTFDDADLEALLMSSRTNNRAAALTGLLLHRDGRFLQVLEGPESSVRERMSVIADDRRHTDIRMLVEEHIDERRFPYWAMEHRPMTSALQNSIPGYNDVFADLDRDTPASGHNQGALEALLHWYRARALQAW
ncbi:BLUF domain-containing protein [Microbacterium sp. P06]|uniref:BLUF domain-containing protein n=1 Tax=unclassified Microbacterium TaxID=2609290 RepID=UPI0037460E96